MNQPQGTAHVTPPTPLTLYTFAMSHYSEKIRWTLDVSKVPYREQCMSPVFHMLPALKMGKRGQTTLPVLASNLESVQDSTRILDWLNHQHLIDALLPPVYAAEMRAVEQRFNAIGKDVARLLYLRSFGKADAHIIKLWTDHATPAQARFIRLGYPLIRWGFCRKLHINAKAGLRAEQRIEAEVRWLDERFKDGRTFLVGDRFSVADITAAALLAPIACPKEHPVYGDAQYQRAMQDATAPWRGRPAMAWVLRLYREHRGQMMGGVKL
jgi:glutathione S-transferase